MSITYTPGSWYAVAGPGITVVLSPDQRERAALVWAAIDQGADEVAVLDLLLRDGLSTLTGFALATDQSVRLRGPLTAIVGDTVIEPAQPWSEHPVRGEMLRLICEDADGPLREVDAAGLVKVSGLEVAARVAAPVEREQPAGAPGDVDPDPHTDSVAVAQGTMSLAVLADPAVASLQRPVARLVFAHGIEQVVDRPVLVGRAPREQGEPAVLISVPSPHHEVSATHLEIRPGEGADHGAAVITDLGSTNGTVLVQPGLAPEALRPGVSVQLLPGAVIDCGDGVSIQVTRPEST